MGRVILVLLIYQMHILMTLICLTFIQFAHTLISIYQINVFIDKNWIRVNPCYRNEVQLLKTATTVFLSNSVFLNCNWIDIHLFITYKIFAKHACVPNKQATLKAHWLCYRSFSIPSLFNAFKRKPNSVESRQCILYNCLIVQLHLLPFDTNYNIISH